MLCFACVLMAVAPTEYLLSTGGIQALTDSVFLWMLLSYYGLDLSFVSEVN